jgi:hypothetical protein
MERAFWVKTNATIRAARAIAFQVSRNPSGARSRAPENAQMIVGLRE